MYPLDRSGFSNLTPATPNNKLAEKWTEQKVANQLCHMLNFLTVDERGEYPENPVRANKIKLQKELCIMFSVSPQMFSYWKQKFTNKTRLNERVRETEKNRDYSRFVTELICKIEDICECRLLYSGTPMDMFILKKHYGYHN